MFVSCIRVRHWLASKGLAYKRMKWSFSSFDLNHIKNFRLSLKRRLILKGNNPCLWTGSGNLLWFWCQKLIVNRSGNRQTPWTKCLFNHLMLTIQTWKKYATTGNLPRLGHPPILAGRVRRVFFREATRRPILTQKSCRDL